MEKGVIVGSDKNQEWLLPWWWENYHKYNNLPVVFFDFGMSDAAKQFCEEKGTVISIKEEVDTDIKNVPYEYLSFWKIRHGIFCIENNRSAWFKKPFACLSSPFKITIWIDLDCKIKGNIEPIFSFFAEDKDICIQKNYIEPIFSFFAEDKDICIQKNYIDQTLDLKLMNLINPNFCESEISYNSGVFLFNKTSPLIQDWCDLCKQQSHLFRGDDEVLSRLIHQKSYAVCEFPLEYHIQFDDKEDPKTIIRHYVGKTAKIFLLNEIKESTVNPQ